jgi:hypothetical protein
MSASSNDTQDVMSANESPSLKRQKTSPKPHEADSLVVPPALSTTTIDALKRSIKRKVLKLDSVHCG